MAATDAVHVDMPVPEEADANADENPQVTDPIVRVLMEMMQNI